jgi:hypothetical protein
MSLPTVAGSTPPQVKVGDMPQEITEITIHEDGSETHESWITMTASKVSSSPGAHLFDSEIVHQHYIQVTVSRCKRKRDLNRDRTMSTQKIAEFAMSLSQWGAFVSSSGQGSGVPATLMWLNGPVAQAPHDPRLGQSMREVREAGDRALEQVSAAVAAVRDAFDRNAGKREMRDLMRNLESATSNAPRNMEFAAKSLVEHSENVVSKARADIEAMIAAGVDTGDRTLDAATIRALGSGESQ